MKKMLALFVILTMIFMSCQKDETGKTDDSDIRSLTFNMQTPVVADFENAPVPTRYVIEAYEDEVLNAIPVRVEGSSTNLAIELKQDTRYKVLFWADKGTAGTLVASSNDYYDADHLQRVQVNMNSNKALSGDVAFFQCISFNTVDFDKNAVVQLKVAVATLKFEETDDIASLGDKLSLTYPGVVSLNIATGEVVEKAQPSTRTFDIVQSSGKEGIIVIDYVLAPQNKKMAMNLSVALNNQAVKAVNDVPFQQDFTTTISGAFASGGDLAFTFDDNTDVAKRYKVGDLYPDDKNPVGLVFWVDPTNSKKGKAFSLDESKGMTWRDASNWVKGLNTGKITWTLPTKEEMKMIFAYYSGKNYNDISSSWGDYRRMPGCDDATVEPARNTLNSKLKNNGGKSFVEDYYWTSTEYNDAVWIVDFNDGYNYDDYDNNYYRTRGIHVF